MNVPDHIYVGGVLYIRARPVQLEATLTKAAHHEQTYGYDKAKSERLAKRVARSLEALAEWASPQPEPAVTHYDHLLTIAGKKDAT